jgi:hypothetical protein
MMNVRENRRCRKQAIMPAQGGLPAGKGRHLLVQDETDLLPIAYSSSPAIAGYTWCKERLYLYLMNRCI